MMYKVVYQFRLSDIEVSDGKWHDTFLDNDGKGYTFEDAENIACEIRCNNLSECRWVEVKPVNEK